VVAVYLGEYIKDSGLNKGVQDKTPLFLAEKVSLRVHSKAKQNKTF